MTPDDIIKSVCDRAGEWLEMSENPDDLIKGILANDIIRLKKYINYLEKRVKYYENRKLPNYR